MKPWGGESAFGFGETAFGGEATFGGEAGFGADAAFSLGIAFGLSTRTSASGS